MEDDQLLQIQGRINEPVVWLKTDNFKIQDLKETQYNEAIRLIKHHSFDGDPLCESIKFSEDEQSIDAYMKLIKIWMKDSTSLIASSIKSGRIIGVAVNRINNNDFDKMDVYNQVRIYRGTSLSKIMSFKNSLMKQTQAYDTFDQRSYLRVYKLCVHPSYRLKGIDVALLRSSIRLATTLKLNALGGIFNSAQSQSIARDAGLNNLSEIQYRHWKINRDIVFNNPGLGNYSAAFMGISILESND